MRRDSGLDDLSDEVLMAEVAAGSRPAFDILARRHMRRSLGVAMRVVGNGSDAEEVVQDAFMQVWRHAVNWRGDEARFTTWLYRIVVNRALSSRRRPSVFAPIEDAVDVVSPQPNAEAELEAKQMREQVDAAIAALPERQRVAIGLCVHGELTCAEAARVLEISVSAMESLLVRARRALRVSLEPAFGPAGEVR